MNAQEQFWSGNFGDDYLKRCRVNWPARIPFWSDIIGKTWARSVYEFGCNAGWNLSAIRSIAPHAALYGNDINEQATYQAEMAGLEVKNSSFIHHPDNSIELVFTAGVLIHIAPENLMTVMQSIVHASCDYVLAVEYAAIKEEEVNYRGHAERLWRRPYGALYEAMGLTLVEQGQAAGFDDCAFWLMRK